jgi:hypothetical protein
MKARKLISAPGSRRMRNASGVVACILVYARVLRKLFIIRMMTGRSVRLSSGLTRTGQGIMLCSLRMLSSVGWNKDHKHVWELQLHVTWVVEGKVYCAVSCKCGRAGWKLAPEVKTSEYS